MFKKTVYGQNNDYLLYCEERGVKSMPYAAISFLQLPRIGFAHHFYTEKCTFFSIFLHFFRFLHPSKAKRTLFFRPSYKKKGLSNKFVGQPLTISNVVLQELLEVEYATQTPVTKALAQRIVQE